MAPRVTQKPSAWGKVAFRWPEGIPFLLSSELKQEDDEGTKRQDAPSL
jgi:hypothetical protein